MKNGAELLDRLIKDIVSESAASYVSVLEVPAEFEGGDKDVLDDPSAHFPTAFSLPRFIPLLRERIWVINPFTRNFLVGWLTLLDSIPDLELVTYLPDFLGGLLKFLGDQNADVRASTQTCLDKFLNEIKRISRVKKGILDAKRLKEGGKRKRQDSMDSDSGHVGLEEGDEVDSDAVLDDERDNLDEDWIPGQDVEINYKEILEILTSSLDSPLGTLGSCRPSTPIPSSSRANNALQRKIVYSNPFGGLSSSSKSARKRSCPSHPRYWLTCSRPWPAPTKLSTKQPRVSTVVLWTMLCRCRMSLVSEARLQVKARHSPRPAYLFQASEMTGRVANGPH